MNGATWRGRSGGGKGRGGGGGRGGPRRGGGGGGAPPRPRGLDRVEALAAALCGPRRKGEAPLGELRYQLLTAVAGAVAEGGRRGTQRVVFLVHEFRTRKTKDGNHAANARDLDAFVYRLSHGAVPQILPGKLHGPIQVPRSEMFPRVP